MFVNSRLSPVLCCFVNGGLLKTSCTDQEVVWREGRRAKNLTSQSKSEGLRVEKKSATFGKCVQKALDCVFLLDIFLSYLLCLQAPVSLPAHPHQTLVYTIKHLQPFTVYRASASCREESGIWSDWSSDVTARTLDRGLQSHREKLMK